MVSGEELLNKFSKLTMRAWFSYTDLITPSGSRIVISGSSSVVVVGTRGGCGCGVVFLTTITGFVVVGILGWVVGTGGFVVGALGGFVVGNFVVGIFG